MSCGPVLPSSLSCQTRDAMISEDGSRILKFPGSLVIRRYKTEKSLPGGKALLRVGKDGVLGERQDRIRSAGAWLAGEGVLSVLWESSERVGKAAIRFCSWDCLYTFGPVCNGVCHLGSGQTVCEGETHRRLMWPKGIRRVTSA